MNIFRNNLITALIVVTALFCSAEVFAGTDTSLSSVKRADLSVAKTMVEAKEYARAIKKLEGFIESTPGSAEAHIALGKANNKIGEFELGQRYLEKAVKLGAAEKDVLLLAGYSLRKLGLYSDAIEKFKRALEYPDLRAEGYFELGYCEYKLLNYPAAIKNLDKSMATDVSIKPKALLYKGIVKYEQKKYDDALKLLEEVLEGEADAVTTTSAKNFIKAIVKKRRLERGYLLSASASLVYDDNVVAVSDSEPVKISDKEDIGAVIYARGGRYFIKEKNRSLFAGYMFYQKLYQELYEYDLQSHNVVLNYTNRFKRSGALSLRYDYSYYSLNGTRYFQKNRFRPVYRHYESKNAYLDMEFLAYYKDYFSENDLTSSGIGGSITQTVEFKDGSSLSIAGAYVDENTLGDAYDYRGYKIKAGMDIKLPKDFSFGLDLGIFNKNYTRVHKVFGVERDDDIKTAYLKLGRELSANFEATLGYDYTFNSSNISYYDYKRNVSYFTIKYTY